MKYHASSHSPSFNPAPAVANRSAGDFLAFANRIIDAPWVWMERIQDRRRLAELDDHLLRDIGVSRAEIEQATSTPFWRK